ncbi:MAG: hypothetical protein KIT84_07835 [Labilithrix sp.]|nr:hypothetical protein [Labilithrix sp.]MCW5810907.1 hypothetical protein [Labilithrix sp.]
MQRAALGCLLVAISAAPFAIFACGDDPANGSPVVPGPDVISATDPDGAPVVVDPLEDAGPPKCVPASSNAPPVPTAALAGSVGGAEFPAAPKSWARPIASLPGFYEVDISEGEASCANADGGTRGVRLIVAGDGIRCSSTDPARAEFYRKTGEPYARPAATEGVLVAKPTGTQLEVGVVIGKFGDPGLPSDGLTGTTTVDVCP